MDNKGNHLLVHEESSINVPAIAAAHVIKRYIAQASDELSFEVTTLHIHTACTLTFHESHLLLFHHLLLLAHYFMTLNLTVTKNKNYQKMKSVYCDVVLVLRCQ